MGNIDIVTRNYMSDNARFADAFNHLLYNGEYVLKPDSLSELDPAEYSLLFDEQFKNTTQKYRDVLKQCIFKQDAHCTYILMGIENQSSIHYALPVKNLLYDALNYERQWSETAKKHRKNHDLSDDEFVSGFARTDRLKPVITLTIYWGVRKWDGPRTLHQILDIPDARMKSFINDYQVHLLVPGEIEDFSKFRTEFGQAVHFMAVSNSSDKIKTLLQTPGYEAISNETVNLINVCTNENFEINEKGGVTNMCRGMDIIRAESRNEGIIDGQIEYILDLLSDMGEIPVDLKEKIQSQQDHDILKRWFKLAARCDSMEDFMNRM